MGYLIVLVYCDWFLSVLSSAAEKLLRLQTCPQPFRIFGADALYLGFPRLQPVPLERFKYHIRHQFVLLILQFRARDHFTDSTDVPIDQMDLK